MKKERENYLKILKDNLNFNTHLEDKNDNNYKDELIFCQSLLILIEKFENSISPNVTRTNIKDTIINISRNTKSKDVSNNSKLSFESTKNKKEQNINVKLKDNKISNFQKSIP